MNNPNNKEDLTMKNKNSEKRRGFFTGFAAALLVAGLTVSAASAYGRTISVNDDIRLSINGAEFIPLDVGGTAVEVFTYNGTTYAPIRAICEAVGLDVQYDSQNRIARIVDTKSGQMDNYIGEDAARKAAFSHAGVTDTAVTKSTLKWDDGRAVYEIDFISGSAEYDYEIDALTGKVLEFDIDRADNRPTQGQSSTDGLISADKAKSIALAKAPGASVVRCQLDYDDGRAVYEIELRSGRTEYDCDIDAKTGTVLDWDVDYDD